MIDVKGYLFNRDLMKQTLRTVGHCTSFNNEHKPSRIVSYKRSPCDKCKSFKRENVRSNVCIKQ